MSEVIRLPYSVFSHDRRGDLIRLIEEMGYTWAKDYPKEDDKGE